MRTQDLTHARPANSLVRIGADGAPWIEGYRCSECGAVMASQPMACRCCGSRTLPQGFRAAASGRLHSWSVIHRSFPGVSVPFVSAIIDLDDGLTLKGTLRGVEEASLRHGLPVTLVFDDAGGARDEDGAPYVGFHFEAQGEVQ